MRTFVEPDWSMNARFRLYIYKSIRCDSNLRRSSTPLKVQATCSICVAFSFLLAYRASQATDADLAAKSETSVLANLRAETPFSNRRSISTNVRPFGSGRRKYDHSKQLLIVSEAGIARWNWFDLQEAGTSPKECGLCTPIPCSRVEHSRRQSVCDNARDIEAVARQHDRLVA